MKSPIAVIAARCGHQKLWRSHLLKLDNKSLIQISIDQARAAGLPIVITTDIHSVVGCGKASDVYLVQRPEGLRDGERLLEAVKHAVLKCIKKNPDYTDRPIVLLQPTSPFRDGGIIQRCIDAYYQHSDASVYSGGRGQAWEDGQKASQFWDGCVAVFPPDGIREDGKSILVQNDEGNGLQINTEQDYIAACVQRWRASGKELSLVEQELRECVAKIAAVVDDWEVGPNGRPKVLLVGRSDSNPLPSPLPAAYVNHCRGYEGGRADILFVIAGKNTKRVGINKELREVAQKARLVVVRNRGDAPWLLSRMPEIKEKCFVLNSLRRGITTGAIASMLLHLAGAEVERVGFQHGLKRVKYLRMCFSPPLSNFINDEIAVLEVSGKDRAKPAGQQGIKIN